MAEEPVVESILLAQNVILNAGTGNVSVIEIFNDLRAPAFPCVIAFHVVSIVRDAFRDFEFEATVQGGDGSLRWQGKLPIPKQKDPILYIDMAAAPIALLGPEQLSVVVRINGHERRRSVIPVRLAQQAATPSIRG